MCFEDDYIWVTSTTIDLALKIDLYGNVQKIFQPRKEKEFQDLFNVVPLN